MTDTSLNYGGYGSNSGESLSQAIERIVGQIQAGERSFDSVRSGIGSSGVGMGGDADARASAQGTAAIRARVQAIFNNAGIHAGNYNQSAPTPNNPNDARSRQSAFADIQPSLDHYGLGSLGGWVEQMIRDDVPHSKILNDMRELPEFKQRFPAIEARRAAGLAPISPEEYVNYERQARQILSAAGLPAGFFDTTEDFTAFLSGDVSLAELSGRAEAGFTAVAQAPAAVRDAFRNFFGAEGDAALAAYFLDSSRALPVLEKQIAVAQAAGAGSQFGFNLDQAQATAIAETGVGYEGARQGFEQIGAMEGLLSEWVGEQDLTAEGAGVDATFGVGDSAGARRALRQREGGRRAQFGGSGSAGAATNQRGTVGLGAADSR